MKRDSSTLCFALIEEALRWPIPTSPLGELCPLQGLALFVGSMPFTLERGQY